MSIIRARSVASVAAVTAAALVGLSVVPTAASADTLPQGTDPVTVAADSLPTAQIDGGVVWDQAISGNTVYAGGEFSNARPPGAEPGQNLVARPNVLAYNINTGQLTGFAPQVNGTVHAVAAAPDGSRIYIAGNFTSVNGYNKYRIAALDPVTGAVDHSFNPAVNYRIQTMVATNDTVYVGGDFQISKGQARPRLASFAASNGALTAWAPTADDTVMAMTLTPDGSKLVVGGQFLTINGEDHFGMAAIDPVSGATVPWAASDVVRNAGPRAAINSLSADNDSVYGTGYVFGKTNGIPKGNWEGVFAADGVTGDIKWLGDCHGDHYDSHSMNGVVYGVGHAHECDNIGSFPRTSPWTWHRGLAFTKDAVGTVQKNKYGGYYNHEGQPAPKILHWWPDLAVGSYTGQEQAAWTITGNDDYLIMGGEFPSVNGQTQQGLARFAVKEIAPNQEGPVETGSAITPAVNSLFSGTVRVRFQANWDFDNEFLNYRLVRDGDIDNPISEGEVGSVFYNRPILAFNDEGLTPGAVHSYRLYVDDGMGNTAVSDSVDVTVSDSNQMGLYGTHVFADNPDFFWRLGEAAGPEVFDWYSGYDGVAGAGVTRGTDGAILGDTNTASSFSGNDTGIVSGQVAAPAVDTFTTESWIRTTTNSGGKILGFGDKNAGNSNNYDRHVYMRNDGKITYGVYPGSTKTITTPDAYNDGQWHHIATTLGPDGMQLYVDGDLIGTDASVTNGQIYNGYWRIGGDNLNGWPGKPSSRYFDGDIDEVAVYSTVLTPAQVATHYSASGHGVPLPNVPPVASFGWSNSDLMVSLDGSGSSDFDGSVVGYSWDLGDGNTANGVAVDHEYAVAGTYEVTLTVTDDDGDSHQVSQDVTVTDPPEFPVWVDDPFDRVESGGWGVSPDAGAWSHNKTGQFSADGSDGFVVIPQAGWTRKAWLPGVSQTETEVRTAVTLDQVQTGGGTYVSVLGRRVSGNTDYRAKVRFNSAGQVVLYLDRMVGGSKTTLASMVVPGLSYVPGEQLNVTMQAMGSGTTDLAVKVWKDGESEPVDWQLTASDSTPELQVAGAVGLDSYLSGSSSSAPMTIQVHNFWAGTVDNVAPNAAFNWTANDHVASFDANASSDLDGDVVDYSWDFGDGNSANGVDPIHDFGAAGTYAVTLTVTDGEGATGQVTHDVTVVDNVPPVASFGWSNSDLMVSLDGSGSSDFDGSVVGYSWDLGDGNTANGVAVDHEYAVAGTYEVTLTVTDDDGDSHQVSQDVTVTDPPEFPVWVDDPFDRVESGGWGVSPDAGAWSHNKTGQFSADGSDGFVVIPQAGWTRKAWLPGVSQTETEVRTAVTLDQVQTGGGTYVSVLGRRVSGNTDYRAKVRFNSAGQVVLYLDRMVGGSKTTLASMVVPGLSYVPGEQLNVTMQAMGSGTTDLAVKVWKDGESEPVDWQLTASDSTPELQVAGAVGLDSYLSGSSSSAPMTIQVHNFWAGTVAP